MISSVFLQKLKENLLPLTTIGFVLLLYLCFYQKYLFGLSPDGISYVEIAENLSKGNFYDGINGYWSPLIAILQIPLVWLKMPEKFQFLIVNFLSTITILLILQLWLKKLGLPLIAICGITIYLTPFLTDAGLCLSTPDLLAAATGLIYLVYSEKTDLNNRYGHFIILGIAGAITYYSKHFFFLYFIIHFPLIVFIKTRFSLKDTFANLKNIAFTYLSFFTIAGIYIALISWKYGYLTFSTAGRYNLSLIGPGSKGHPMHWQGLIDLPYKTATSCWTDPSFTQTTQWFSVTKNNCIHFSNILIENFKSIFYHTHSYVPFAVWIIAAILFYLLSAGWRKKQNYDLLFITVSILLYWSLYALVLIEGRYLILPNILLFTAAVILLEHFIENIKILDRALFKNLVYFLFLCICILRSATYVNSFIGKEEENNIAWEKVADEFRIKGIGGRIASNAEWDSSLSITYLIKGHYLGMNTSEETEEDLIESLKKHKIDFYLSWEKHKVTLPNELKLIHETSLDDKALKVYLVRQ